MTSSKHQRKPGGRKKYAEGELEGLKSEAVKLKRAGVITGDIATELGISHSSAKRWTAGTKRGTKRQPTVLSLRNLDRQKKQEMKDDRERNKLDTAEEIDGDRRTLFMPVDPDVYNTTGPEVSPHLLQHAADVLDTWTTDKAEGRLITVTGIELVKATYVHTHAFKVHDWEGFAENRMHWGALRELAGIRMEEVADRAGISFASVSRYEVRAGQDKPKRNPDPSVARRLMEVYKSIQETFLVKHEQQLAIYSYAKVHDTELDLTNETDHAKLHNWIGGETASIQDLDLSHVTALHQMRQMMPYPTWRQPVPSNFWLTGYAKQLVPA